ncbi:TetR/AcrR family transcriptional regulator [Nocardia sp. NPDC050175]|uniref:TetR/AcrR family transcriptional regulator n=1 Tax=Nocardia sp. NPDC050175 TaxID=3364317 RepID=UPI003789D418
MRRKLLDATASVYATHGQSGLTAERIAHTADVSKPTFYKYFPNSTAALDELVADGNQQLRARIERAVGKHDDLPDKVAAAIDAYLDWGIAAGDSLLVYHGAGLHSPTNATVAGVMVSLIPAPPGAIPAPELISMALAAFQAGCVECRLHPGRRQEIKAAMLRIAFATIGWHPMDATEDSAAQRI